MNVKILCVGKIKEKFYRDAIDEYVKRLSKYCSVTVTEVPDEKTSENASDTEIDIVKDKEGERILKHINERDYVIALAILGKQMDSVAFSKFIEDLGIQGKSSLVFVIGGSLGLSDNVLKRADYQISFSKMTFPHQLMRVILSEQIYRAMRIMKNEPYHK
ncbi:23S rRNA (pseudouridine1915-N3)-methyltransferase [Pseudobutyrivibrio sp. 49]|uniref:23S rRNA (pseudouridine(1915)-N(3))-methyltransferase RlmH n=1 Tax=unclassified Pseudobutyrivibrio TaxID=2638619 RepID=UPI00088E6DF6|nr:MULTISPECIES: 23S rRNA (pseudouridine(1915)-N(3))-methyltransferase RlmH [unclassified Pseudobutyrivibrio]SDH42636.1 23S rRNA (pseudouridine1915-N3)-methyltransferase [Pseudobutyrivibrio sp. 49]SFN44947.1 23S rRNA (pseudouridine1915-N3)-methyltransferase [Pseudobutyrivibrio sp. UC1225]